jgi:hypothetical protein
VDFFSLPVTCNMLYPTYNTLHQRADTAFAPLTEPLMRLHSDLKNKLAPTASSTSAGFTLTSNRLCHANQSQRTGAEPAICQRGRVGFAQLRALWLLQRDISDLPRFGHELDGSRSSIYLIKQPLDGKGPHRKDAASSRSLSDLS